MAPDPVRDPADKRAELALRHFLRRLQEDESHDVGAVFQGVCDEYPDVADRFCELVRQETLVGLGLSTAVRDASSGSPAFFGESARNARETSVETLLLEDFCLRLLENPTETDADSFLDEFGQFVASKSRSEFRLLLLEIKASFSADQLLEELRSEIE